MAQIFVRRDAYLCHQMHLTGTPQTPKDTFQCKCNHTVICNNNGNDDDNNNKQERRTSFLLFQAMPFSHNNTTPFSAAAALTNNPYFPSVPFSGTSFKKKHPNKQCQWHCNNTTTHNNKPFFQG
eukprot:5563754-Ditylum_brightwellii.AAC.1